MIKNHNKNEVLHSKFLEYNPHFLRSWVGERAKEHERNNVNMG